MPTTTGRGHSNQRHTVGRRAYITLWLSTVGCLITFALGILVAPLVAQAQRWRTIPLVGVLDPGLQYQQSPSVCHAGFQQGLRDLGYVEGQHITFEYRYAQNRVDRLPTLAAELVRLTPDVLWTYTVPAALAAKQATPTIPIVIGPVANLVEQGLVESLERPGGNLTGLALQDVERTGKRLELLKEAVPTIARVALLVDPTKPEHAYVPGNIEREAQALGVQLQRVEASGPEAFEAAFAAMVHGGADALMIMESSLFGRDRHRLLELALQHRLSTMCSGRHFAEAGSLLAYGPHVAELCQRSAVFVDKILKGAKPATLSVEQAYKFSLVVNLKTAAALGLTLPPAFLFQADEVLK